MTGAAVHGEVPAPVVGVDLGADAMRAAALRDGTLGEPATQPTERWGADPLLDQVTALVEQVRPDGLAAVGVALPRVVEHATGRALTGSRTASPHTDPIESLAGIALREVLTERLGVPVIVEQDDDAAALAEAHDESLQLAVEHLVLFAVGGHLGSGLVIGGRIHHGASGRAGQLGQTIVGLDLAGSVPSPMGNPQPGSLEFLAAGSALDRLAGVATRVHPQSALARLRAQGKPVLGSDVVTAAREGDESARRMVEIWGQRLGIAIANAIHALDPQEVVLVSDIAGAAELLIEPAKRVVGGYVRSPPGTTTAVRTGRHGAHRVALGAALSARDYARPADRSRSSERPTA